MEGLRNNAINVFKSMYTRGDLLMNGTKWLTNDFKNIPTELLIHLIKNQTHLPAHRRWYRLTYGRNAPVHANIQNISKLKKLPKTILSRNTTNTNLPKKGENFRGRKQTKGTCWYQAILNGWMLSDKGRIVMKRKLQAFKQSHEMKPFTNMKACPMRGKIPSVYFWSYVDFMFRKSKNSNFYSNVMRGIEFPEGKLIRSSHMRSNLENVVGGATVIDNIHFSEFLFGKNSHDVVIYNTSDTNPPRSVKGYTLSHGTISGTGTGKDRGHAIAMYISRGKPMIFDSNYEKPFQFDWINHREELIKYFENMYGYKNVKTNTTFTYIRNNIINYNKPEMSFNVTKFNKTKSLNRYPNAYILKFFREVYNSSNFINSNNNNIRNYINKKQNYKKIRTIRSYLNAGMNLIGIGNTRVKLRRMYREKFKKPAPSNMTNENIAKAINKPELIYILNYIKKSK